MSTAESSLARLYKRIFFFILGSPLSIGLNLGLFTLCHYHLGLSERVAYFISLTTITFIFSLWNYFVNFRSSRNYLDCLPRYIVALGCCYLINYLLAQTGFKKISETYSHRPDAVLLYVKLLQYAAIVISTFLVSGVKFLLYHFWVYPHTPEQEPAAV